MLSFSSIEMSDVLLSRQRLVDQIQVQTGNSLMLLWHKLGILVKTSHPQPLKAIFYWEKTK